MLNIGVAFIYMVTSNIRYYYYKGRQVLWKSLNICKCGNKKRNKDTLKEMTNNSNCKFVLIDSTFSEEIFTTFKELHFLNG